MRFCVFSRMACMFQRTTTFESDDQLCERKCFNVLSSKSFKSSKPSKSSKKLSKADLVTRKSSNSLSRQKDDDVDHDVFDVEKSNIPHDFDQKQSVRMMATFIREIQAPVTELCGLKNIIKDIPVNSSMAYYAKSMNTCGILLAEMIESLRLYFTLSSDLYEPDLDAFVLRSELHATWDSIMNHYTTEISEMNNNRMSDVNCTLTLSKRVPSGVVTTDRVLFLRVFKYLIENAIRFTFEGWVDVMVDFETETKKLTFLISDSGVGIPDGTRETIFEPLVKAHSESIPGGIGMGLPLARKMCEELGGFVTLENSKEGNNDIAVSSRGKEKSSPTTTFKAVLCLSGLGIWTTGAAESKWNSVLPKKGDNNDDISVIIRKDDGDGDDDDTDVDYGLENKRNKNAFINLVDFDNSHYERDDRGFSYEIDTRTNSDTPRPEEDPSMPRVLLAEDTKLNQLIVADMLKIVHVKIETANDGAEALKKCHSSFYDVILMDVYMPRMGGIEAALSIRTTCPLNKSTPIVALSSSLSDTIVTECLKSGMVTCIAKPIQRKELFKAIAENVSLAHRKWMAHDKTTSKK